MRYRVISCEVFSREIHEAASRSPHTIDVEFLPKGLHDRGGVYMRSFIQERIDAADPKFHDAILLAYGLCNNGLAGLRAREKPVVAMRAHDCITVFLGSRERYKETFFANPGTYFLTSGWIERGIGSDQPPGERATRPSAFGMEWEQLVDLYGEDNARFLVEQAQAETHNYSRLAYIHMGVEPDNRFEEVSRQRADEKGLRFERMEGNMVLIHALLNGDWQRDGILVVPPGQELIASWDDDVIRAREVESK